MASVVGKRREGRTYYYLVESARVNGEPRIVTQRYLGTAEDIGHAMAGGTSAPVASGHLAFGDVAAGWATLTGLGLQDLVDNVVRARGRPSVGDFLTLAVLHRATAPGTDVAQWWASTAADGFVRPRFPRAEVTATRIWHALRRLTAEHLGQVEAAVRDAVLRKVGTGCASLVVDVPGFASFTGSAGAPVATGRLSGLGVMVTRDGAIPLVSLGYRRDHVGVPPFGTVAAELAERHLHGERTLIFDAGQYSQLDLGSGRHFVGALPLGDFPDLLARPASERRPVDPGRLSGLTALDTRAVVEGVRRRVVLTHSPTLHVAQARAFTHELSAAVRALTGLGATLAEGRHRGTRAQIHAEVARITRARRVDRVLHASLIGTQSVTGLDWRVDETALARLDEDFFGKQLLVTDHEDWPVAEVVTAYRARYHLESTFRWLNNTFVPGPTPRWEWTDQRVAVHTCVSVLAATVTHLMRREADLAGMNLSVRELMERLARIGETRLTYASTGGRPRRRRLLTDRDAEQQRLFELFGMAAFAPRGFAEAVVPPRRDVPRNTDGRE